MSLFLWIIGVGIVVIIGYVVYAICHNAGMMDDFLKLQEGQEKELQERILKMQEEQENHAESGL